MRVQPGVGAAAWRWRQSPPVIAALQAVCHLAQVLMIVESGTAEQFKHSLIYGWGDTVRTTMERMNDKWLTVEYWAEVDGLVTADMTSTLDRHHAMLHIGTYVLRHGLAFDLLARVSCRSFRQGKEAEKCEWSFDKAPARTGPAGESLPAVPAQALRVRQVGVSDNRQRGGSAGLNRPTRGRAANERARRAGALHGFRL